MRLAGWGNYPVVEARAGQFRFEDELRVHLEDTVHTVARGLGRSYGDSSLNDVVIRTQRFDRIISFDATSGRITCEAGLSLHELLTFSIPRGWFAPVTPGTRFVTLGGMLASDVHGKNHHRAGSFSAHVESLTLMRGDGEIVRCSATEDPDLWAATCGGMGLTGVILTLTFRLIPIASAWIRQTVHQAGSLDEMLALFDQNANATYSVAWIDCLERGAGLGRSVLYCGEHAAAERLPSDLRATPLAPRPRRAMSVPIFFPRFVLNPVTVAGFNAFYYARAGRQVGERLVDLDTYFYPLDSVQNWNRIYGRRGFVQYQCVLPKADGREALVAILAEIARARCASFLAVLKLLGSQPAGWLGFPLEGYTLALDFPLGSDALPLLERLDAITRDRGGRVYLTKDARIRADMAAAGYPQWQRFIEFRNKLPGAQKFRSLQSQRLGLS